MQSKRYINNFSANVAIGGTSDLFTLQVPTKCRWRLISFGNYTGTIAAWTVIWWEFLGNEVPISPYERIMDQLGYGPQRQEMQQIEVPGGSTVVIRAHNPTAAICAMGISLEYELEFQE